MSAKILSIFYCTFFLNKIFQNVFETCQLQAYIIEYLHVSSLYLLCEY